MAQSESTTAQIQFINHPTQEEDNSGVEISKKSTGANRVISGPFKKSAAKPLLSDATQRVGNQELGPSMFRSIMANELRL